MPRYILFASLAALLAVACVLAADEPSEIQEGTRALYQGEYARARTLASTYLQAHPTDPVGRMLLARAEMAEGKYSPAFDELRKALDADPTNTDALYYLGRVTTILSQIEFAGLIHNSPNSFRAHQLLAESYQAQQNLSKAEDEYKAALAANPKSVEALDALGDLNRSQYRFDEAIEFYHRAAELKPRDYGSQYGLGACLLYKQQAQQAIAPLRRAVEIDPDSAAGHLALGDALLRAQQAAAAVTELQAAVKLQPDMRQAYTLLARAYARLRQPEAAQEALAKEKELAAKDIQGREQTLGTDAGRPAAPPSKPPSPEPR